MLKGEVMGLFSGGRESRRGGGLTTVGEKKKKKKKTVVGGCRQPFRGKRVENKGTQFGARELGKGGNAPKGKREEPCIFRYREEGGILPREGEEKTGEKNIPLFNLHRGGRGEKEKNGAFCDQPERKT